MATGCGSQLADFSYASLRGLAGVFIKHPPVSDKKDSVTGHEGPAASYQLDLITPGNLPSDANSRKQIRQMPNFRKKPLGRPHIGHRL